MRLLACVCAHPTSSLSSVVWVVLMRLTLHSPPSPMARVVKRAADLIDDGACRYSTCQIVRSRRWSLVGLRGYWEDLLSVCCWEVRLAYGILSIC